MKRKSIFAILCAVLMFWTVGAGGAVPAQAAADDGYLKSATYYSDGWVINFWNQESDHMEEELAQIAADGFNSIILAVPWREFQPGVSPIRYNGYAFEKLDRVFEAAQEAGLSVVLRVGYTWDQAGGDDILERYRKLLYDGAVQTAWMAYVGAIYQAASRHPNFFGGFLTWEDFWNFTEAAGTMGDTAQSRKLAADIGFVSYLQSKFSLKAVNGLYKARFSGWDQVYLPERNSPAYKEFFNFYDGFLNRLLEESQTVFPNLSMEVRVDVDPVYTAAGTQEGYAHASTFGCGNSSYTSLMYAVSMGMEPGQTNMTADQVVSQTAAILDWVGSLNGGKPLYIDQFLFTDNTIGFEENARLAEAEIPIYLARVVGVLKERTMGYGVWTYRDYGNNMIYNSQFALGTEGWTTSGQVTVTERAGSSQARIPRNGRISQPVNPEGSAAGSGPVKVRFDADSPSGCRVTARLGQVSRTVEVSGKTEVSVELPSASLAEFSITADGDVYVDNIQVYTHVTEGKLYDINGKEQPAAAGVRALNDTL